ncbi:Oxidoreductase AflY [Cercospora beticola]|uniref:Oxidoreductase AflY n=1 Tax=Cercospora beticola TaxID=122368 RepID=A0A2G5I2Z7_CERBT|nr:Oxidoreductase AflY [Cercospora beticola]PIA99167.1 Oxidoreductase AflY [Cercospora beticola]WPA99648.1 hypothetical protein RHO25_004266 [Cercospora beticola]CAK1362212.1 unnamed protein product [Cercospora beticola]
MTILATSRLHIEGDFHGYGSLDKSPPGALETLNRLIQNNHDEFDMFWRPDAGHNHTAHSLLSVYALGGSSADLERAYRDDDPHQVPIGAVDHSVVASLKDPRIFIHRMQRLDQYSNYLRFFEERIEARGWKAVVVEYLFSRSDVAEAMLGQLFEGAYHPLIQLGFGIEFELPGLVAEGLAHCAAHDAANIIPFFQKAEKLAKSGSVAPAPLVELYKEVRDTEKIRLAAKMTQGPVRVRDGVMGEAQDDIAAVAAKFQVGPDGLKQAIIETTSCAAYSCGGAQRPGKVAKVDFFFMHMVTSSIFLSILARQDWLETEDKIRLVEWKGRLDLVWYAASSAPALDRKWLEQYQPTLSAGMDWRALYRAVTVEPDDGHLAKIVRSLKWAEEEAKGVETSETIPVAGSGWFKLAQMAYDSTAHLPIPAKWIMGAGYDFLWTRVDSLPAY